MYVYRVFSYQMLNLISGTMLPNSILLAGFGVKRDFVQLGQMSNKHHFLCYFNCLSKNITKSVLLISQ